jgi:hypothetical protein
LPPPSFPPGHSDGGNADDNDGAALDQLEELCRDMPELGAALIRALVAEKELLLQARQDGGGKRSSM